MAHPPGPRGRHALGFFGGGSIGGLLRFLESTARHYGPISSFPVLHKRVYLIDDPVLIEEILVTRQHEFLRDTGATLGRELVGDGLLTRDEPQHRERRRILQPAFHRDQIAAYAHAMVAECERLSIEWQSRQTVDVREEMRRLTLAIVGVTLFGAEFRTSAGRIAEVLQRVTRKSAWLAPAVTLCEPAILAFRRFFPKAPSLFFAKERRQLEEVVTPILNERRSSIGRDFLSLLLAGGELSGKDVLNEVVTFVLAGHETTATALTWAWQLLGRNPSAAAIMRSELDSVLGGRAPVLDDLARLRYTTNVFRETLRLYPSAVLFGRRPKATLDLAGFQIPRGASILLSPYITQRNAKYFEQPDTFLPDRWDSLVIPKFAYFPFGGGAKMCIGESFARMEGLLALAILGQRWNLEHVETNLSAVANGPVLAPNGAVRMRIMSRAESPVPARELLS